MMQTSTSPTAPSSWVLKGALAIGVLSVSSSAILIRLAPAPPASIAFWRLIFTVAIIAPWMIRRKGWQELEHGDGLKLILSGAFLALHFFTWFWSLSIVPVAVSTALVSMHPLMVASYQQWIAKRPLSRRLQGGGILAIAGLLIILASQGFDTKDLVGMALALAGAVFGGGYLITGQTLRAHMSTTTYASQVYLISAVLLGVGQFIGTHSLGPFSGQLWLLYILMAVLPTLGGHTIFNWLLRYTPATTVSLALLGEIAGATFLAWVILQQTPPLATLIGVLVISVGLGLVILRPDTLPIPSPIDVASSAP